MSFQVGDEVVCVDDTFHKEWQLPGIRYSAWDACLVAGQHYVVRSIETSWPQTSQPGPHLRLVGVTRGNKKDCPFSGGRFRKINHKDTELFRQMCVSPKPLVPLPTETGEVGPAIPVDWKRFGRFRGGKD